ncbi:Conserved_hypothetical protein [Hexamita inflata]|uniref:Uncharacterized protein n=1 Tax=Hexamita inflata TaxID=28002 RepID=A0AA86N7D0_9EUKA|nr:Conserved hypothetical protein [Hexamita inflata]CAI9934658.1 Conserved hypothetical protein [Hexamita inflata]
MSDNENSSEYEYYSDDYYSETSDDIMQIQINEMKKQILNMQKVASPPKIEQPTYNKPSPIFQQQIHAQQNESISATAAAVSAAVQTALHNQQQLLMNRNFGYQRSEEFIAENQPLQDQPDYDNQTLSGSQKLSNSQQLYQSSEMLEPQHITTQHIETQSNNQLNETQKIIMSNQQKLQLLAKQKQQVADSIKPIDPIEIQQIQPEQIQKSFSQENQEYIKKIQQLQAKIEEREDVIKSLVRIIKKRDPSFVLAQILGNKQLEKELDKNNIESQNLQTNEAAQNKSRNQANTTIYQEDNRLSESQIQEMKRKSGLQTNQLPNGFKQVSKNANYEQDYQVINNESGNQNAKEYSNNIQKQKQSGISFQMTDEKQTKQQKQQNMSNNQNVQEQKYLDSNEIKQKQSSSIQFDSKPIQQQTQQLKQEPSSVQSQPEPQGVLSFEDFLKQRAKYAAKLEIESSKQEQSSPQFDPKAAEFEQMKQQKQILQQQNEQLQTQLQNRLQQVQQPQYSPPSSYQNLQPQNNYPQQNQPSYQQPNQYQATQQNQPSYQQQQNQPNQANYYQQTQQPQQQQQNQMNYQPQSNQPYSNTQPAFAQPQNNINQPNLQPQNTFQQQNTNQTQTKPYQSQAFDPNFNSYEQIKQNSSAAEHQINKNSNNSDAIKAKMTFDLNNPRYKMFKDVDSKYNVIQQQAEEHKNEMNALLSKKVGRKEQIRINFLEERLKDLFGESARLKVQLKVFEKEFM